jgi:hypothetical protein
MFSVAAPTAPALKVGTPVLLFESPFYIARTGSPRPPYEVTSDGKPFVLLSPSTSAVGDRLRIVVGQNRMEEVKRLIPSD